MKRGPEAEVGGEAGARWSRFLPPSALWGTALAVIVELVYVYGLRFRELVHSDAICLLLMAESAIAARSPISPSWYFSNGDVWLFALPLAGIPTAVAGVGVETLRVCDLLGFALEIAVLAGGYRVLEASKRNAVFAALATLLCISEAQFYFVYVELAYGFLLTTYVGVFVLFARLLPAVPDEPGPKLAQVIRDRGWLGAAGALVLVSASNPTRFLAYGILPLLLAAIWPWRGVRLRFRAVFVGVVLAAFGASIVIARVLFARWLTFAPYRPPKLLGGGLAQIEANLVMIGRGVLFLAGGSSTLSALPGLVVMIGAVAIVVGHVLGGRHLVRTRFFGLLLLAVLATIGASLVVGNVMFAPSSIRYLLPAWLPMLGLGVVLVTGPSWTGWRRRAGLAWLVLLPLVGLLGFVRTRSADTEAQNPQWENRTGHIALTAELHRRDLRHGFATYWRANLVTLFAENRPRVCPILANDDAVIPYRWGVDATCFDPERFASEVFFVAEGDERKAFRAALGRMFGPPRERFEVAGAFEVSVYPSAGLARGWLDLPLPRGPALRYPLHLTAAHEAFRRDRATVTPDGVVASGEEGLLIHGPFVDMSRGSYVVTFTGLPIASPGRILFEVYAAGRVFADSSIPTPGAASSDGDAVIARLPFTLDKDTDGLELLVRSEGGAKVILRAITVDRLADP